MRYKLDHELDHELNDCKFAELKPTNHCGDAVLRFWFAIATVSLVSLVIQPQATQAQVAQPSPQDLGIPTESQRFFSQGRQQFEREIDRLQARPQTASALQINETVNPQHRLRPLEDPRIQPRSQRDRPVQSQPSLPVDQGRKAEISLKTDH